MLDEEERRKQSMLVNTDRYRVYIPEHKRDLVQPILTELFNRVFGVIDQKAQDHLEAKKAI